MAAKLDRLGRSLRHLVDTITGLADRGIGFRSLQEAIDTTTPGGKLVFHVFAALAEFEHDLIRERTAAGLAAARARGRRGGRPSVLSGHKLQVAQEMYASGQYTVSSIARPLGSAGLRSTATPPQRWRRSQSARGHWGRHIPARVIDELMGHERSRRGELEGGSRIGARYRHTTPEMAVRVAAAIQERLVVVVQIAEVVLELDGSGGRVF
jgi:Resolvase, N terminal domain